jgi:hypothetical protein
MKHRCGKCGKLKICKKAEVKRAAWCYEWKRRSYKEIFESCSSRIAKISKKEKMPSRGGIAEKTNRQDQF